MRNLLFSVFAIAVAAVAAMTATTAMLNAPQRSVPTVETAALAQRRARAGQQAGDHRGYAAGHARRYARRCQTRGRFCRRSDGRCRRR